MIEIEKKYKYIFFDIFDTIVSRKINPEYVKKIRCGHIIQEFTSMATRGNAYF